MRPWKAVLGVGAACAACCAVPLVGGAAALAAGSTLLAGMGAALLACADELVPLAGVLLALAVVGGGLFWWRRRAARQAQRRCGEGATRAETDAPIACSLPAGALEQRMAWIRRVTAGHLLSHRVEGTTLRLQYRAQALPELEQIVAQERQCCPFLAFSLQPSADTVTLVIAAPQGVGPDARQLFDAFLPPPANEPAKACGCAPGACG